MSWAWKSLNALLLERSAVCLSTRKLKAACGQATFCAVEPYLNCGACSACRRGRMNCCSHLRVLGVHTDGGMRELITVPIEKLHRSETLPLEHLALVETLCIGAHCGGPGRPGAGTADTGNRRGPRSV